jgi:hypothetical protein
MTLSRLAALASLAAGTLFTTTVIAQAPPREALDRLTRARAAMGGTAELAAVRTLSLKVHDRDRMGTWFPDKVAGRPPRFDEGRSELRVLLPDHFLEATTYLTGTVHVNRWGFAGGADQRASASSRAVFGHLMLAMLLKTDTLFPFALKDMAGDVLRFVDPYGVDVFVELHPTSHLPQRVRYDEVVRDRDGQPTGQTRPRRVELGGYAPVGRLHLAHSRTTYQGDTLLQERRVEAIEINPKLTPADFK